MSAPLVSIIIPAYNAAPWIRETLDSAFAQTHPQCEIIVIDDGSRDDTVAIARKAGASRPHQFRLETQANAGASAARNHGLRQAQGEFIQFLDADDLLSPRKIELQIASLALAPAGAVATCRWGRFETDPAAARFVDEEVFHDFAPLDWLVLHASAAKMMHPAAWLVPRSIVDAAGPWNETLSLNDDGEYFARVVLASGGITFTQDPAAATYYRSGLSDSLSHRRTMRACESLYRTGELLARHLLQCEDSPRIRQALADHWQYLAYELHPHAPRLSREAEHQAQALGGSQIPPPLGARAARLARFIGWRLARTLSHKLPR
jgi:glycosyltransferase involved in cell wall biosynthesis